MSKERYPRLTPEERRLHRELARRNRKAYHARFVSTWRRVNRNRRLTPSDAPTMQRHGDWDQQVKARALRERYFDEVDNPELRPKPLPPRPPRRDKRRPGKPR